MTDFTFSRKGLEDYVPNEDAESHSGVWVPLPSGIRVRILRAGGSNRKFQRAYQSALKPYRRQIDAGTMDPEQMDAIARAIYARHIVQDWEHVRDEDEKEIPFSPQACEAFFKVYPSLFNELLLLSTEQAIFSQARIVEAQTDLGES